MEVSIPRMLTYSTKGPQVQVRSDAPHLHVVSYLELVFFPHQVLQNIFTDIFLTVHDVEDMLDLEFLN